MPQQALAQKTAGQRVVIVDDDDLFRESLGLNLGEAGYEVQDFASGEAALDYLLGDGAVDILLLDWRMPGLDGPGVLHKLREARIDTPVIFLTLLSDEIYEEAALKWGAVDFIDKSRRLPIILQRLKLITEGVKPSAGGPAAGGDRPFSRGPLELRLGIKRAYWGGAELDLTLTEFSIVQLLATRNSGDVSYRQIYDVVRGKDFLAGHGREGYRANVRSFIKRIRKKFRDVDGNFDHIDNYPGFGYRWRDQAGGGGAAADEDDDER
ncbi:MAG: response regulator transcription factor [Kiloniellales bacterium]